MLVSKEYEALMFAVEELEESLNIRPLPELTGRSFKELLYYYTALAIAKHNKEA